MRNKGRVHESVVERAARELRADSPPAEAAAQEVAEPVPLHLRNAPTRLMQQLEYGKDYRYAHDEADGTGDAERQPGQRDGVGPPLLGPLVDAEHAAPDRQHRDKPPGEAALKRTHVEFSFAPDEIAPPLQSRGEQPECTTPELILQIILT